MAPRTSLSPTSPIASAGSNAPRAARGRFRPLARSLLATSLVFGLACTPSPEPEAPRLDPRAPYPLTPEEAWAHKLKMMGFLSALARMQEGFAEHDLEAVQRALSPMALKPGQDCDTPLSGIQHLALVFRCQTAAVRAAAQAGAEAVALRESATLIETCNACHAAYRDEVRPR